MVRKEEKVAVRLQELLEYFRDYGEYARRQELSSRLVRLVCKMRADLEALQDEVRSKRWHAARCGRKRKE